MARDLVAGGADLIFASGGDQSTRAAIAAPDKIPIVLTTGNGPVAAGYAQSLNKPGRNVTGITFVAGELEAKQRSCAICGCLFPSRMF